MSYLEKFLFKSSTHSLIELFEFLLLIFLYISDVPLVGVWFVSRFSHLVGCFFTPLFPLLCRSFLVWRNLTCQFLLFLLPVLLVSYQNKTNHKQKNQNPPNNSNNHCPGQGQIGFALFSSSSSMVSGLMVKFVINCDFFVCYVRYQSIFILTLVEMEFSQYHLLKRLFCPYCIFLAPLLTISWPWVHGFISELSILFYWSKCLLLL